MTTEDSKTEIEVPTSHAPEPKPDARRRKLRKIGGLIAGAAAVGTVLAGLTGYWTTYRTVTKEILAPAKPAPVEAAHLSIVVLPFANLSGDPSQDYFADGITEDLTTDLSRIRNSFVIARNTAFTYKGKNIDAKEIGKELGVRYVLEGSVQRDQDRVRVNAQLIDAHGGAHLWADHFDTTRANLLQMQDEIVARLANTLGFELLKAETQRSAHSTNPDADDLAMRCAAVARTAGFLGKEAEAGYRLCEQALDADPNNVLALTTLSSKFYLAVFLHRSADPQADLKRADELASRALAVDANSAAAHFSKGHVLIDEGRFDDAIAECERALALDPNNAIAVGDLGGTYTLLGQYEKAIEFTDKAIRLSPRDPALFFWYWHKSIDSFGLQQYDQAIEWARRSIAINPNFAQSHGYLAVALALTGHEAEARDALQRRNALSPTKSIAAVKAALTPPPSADPRVRASSDRWLGRLIEGLRKAGMPEE
jgi:TolB-like protein/cytochrome c-type biogenesis protein CcmH/NrfG